jgi:hypothetical protein
MAELLDHDPGVPDVRMASIIERLRNAKLAVVDSGRSYDSERSWIDNALTEHHRAPFHAIIAQQNPGGNTAVLPVADLDEHQPLMMVSQDRAVSRETESITEALSGFLRFSTRILFVDPFLTPTTLATRARFGRVSQSLRQANRARLAKSTTVSTTTSPPIPN